RKLQLPRSKRMLVSGEIHFAAPKTNAFHLEQETLLGSSFKTKLDLATGADHPLPRDGTSRSGPQKPRDGAMVQRISRGGSHLAVGGDFPLRNREDQAAKSRVPKFVGPGRVLRDSANQFS